MSVLDKYHPTSQKSLFHNNVVSHIRKWIAVVLDSIENRRDARKVLLIYGPSGCGKTTTVDVLLKAFNVIKIDPSEIKGSKVDDIINGTLKDGYSKILTFKTSKPKPNIVFMDGIETSDCNLGDFISRCFKLYNIAFVMTATAHSQRPPSVYNIENVKLIELKVPSMLELVRLGTEISDKENLGLSPRHLERIVNLSEGDVRQFLYIINQWKIRPSNIEEFLKCVGTATRDVDLSTKMQRLTSSDPYDFTAAYQLCISDTALISNQMFQNYVSADTSIENLKTIADCYSTSNLVHSKLFDDQMWELYDSYIVSSCVTPSFLIKSNRIEMMSIVPFKDVSSNFANSLRDIRDICSKNFQNKLLHNSDIRGHSLHTSHDTDTSFILTKLLLHHCTIISEYYNKNKKGQNTSKLEKIALCEAISNDPLAENSLHYVVDIVVEYRLFEIDLQKIVSSHKDSHYPDKFVFDNVEKVELRTMKRFMNIHNLGSTVNIKSNVEMAIKYNVMRRVVSHLEATNINLTNRVENLIVDLCDVWTLA